MKIGEKTLRKGGEMLTNSLLTYITKINEAYQNNLEATLKISLSLSIAPGVQGSFLLKTDINFVLEKITDSFTDSSDELQQKLFDSIENLRPGEDSSIDSVTISAGDKSITLEKKSKQGKRAA
ncbi:MAG: hypothetical protein A2031_08100 [Deltaproteobacteria bacterium RBG_19FT_COMBO_43_11]|nr:MAG: hypothetical protein A2031_08100 [Deltaproteobacteria bacterium RBG_19FT_COMBO_43_11]